MAAPALRAMCTGLLGAGLLASCVALAASGTVNFRGAVVEPTCYSPGAERVARTQPGKPPRRVTCPSPATLPTSVVQAYTLEVVPASAAPTGSLLAPLDAMTGGRAPVQVDQLLTRVYE